MGPNYTIGKTYYLGNAGDPVIYQGCEALFFCFLKADGSQARFLESELAANIFLTDPTP